MTAAEVCTLHILETLRQHCLQRNDDWGNGVFGRLPTCSDLVAEEAVYHIACMNKFRSSIPTGNKTGRPADSTMQQNFQKIYKWLEEDADSELYTLKEVHQKVLDLSEETSCYGIRYLKRMLLSYYGDHVYFTESNGRPDMVCFKSFSWYIFNNFKTSNNQSPTDIIEASAKIIKSDIRAIDCDKSTYPKIEQMADIEYAKQGVPGSLLLFLKLLTLSELKQVRIGQCISQCSHPRSMIASIPFGIGVDVEKSFATKWFENHLSRLGFSISYDEVRLFKQSYCSFRAHHSFRRYPSFRRHHSFRRYHSFFKRPRGTLHTMDSR